MMLKNQIYVKEKQFIIDDKSHFLVGAEFHYFRVPMSLWEERLQKIKNCGCNVVSTYIPWNFHELEEGNIDISGQRRPETDLIKFLELTLKYDLYCIVRPGPYVMAEIKYHGIPKWLIENYEEVLAITKDGNIHPIQVVTYMHPTFLEKVEMWYKAVLKEISKRQITQGGNIIMVQLDNEVGMLHWVTHSPDYSDTTMKYLEVWLNEKFNLLDINKELAIELDSMKEFVDTHIKVDQKATALKTDYLLGIFYRDYHKKYIEKLKSLGEKYGLQVPFIVNIHGFDRVDIAKRGLRYPIGLSQLYETAKIENVVMAGDYYVGNIWPDNFFDVIMANTFTEAIQPKEQCLFSAEFQGGFQADFPILQPTTYNLKTRLCIANGMNAINYYMFVGGENYDDIGLNGRRHDWQAPISTNGNLKNQYFILKYLIEVIRAYGEPLVEAEKVVRTHIGFIPDYYMTEFDNLYTKEMKNTLKHYREAYLAEGAIKALAFKNIPFGAIDLQNNGPIDVKQVPTLWVMSTKWMSKTIQVKLLQYIIDGGILILFPEIPLYDMKGEGCTVLKEALNVDIVKEIHGTFITVEDIDSTKIDKAQVYDIDEGFSYIDENNNLICGFSKKLGTGKAIVFGVCTQCDYHYKLDIYERIANQAGIYPMITSDEWLECSIRRHEKGEFLFVHNFDEYDKVTKLYKDKAPLFDGNPLYVPMRNGLILPINWRIFDDFEVVWLTGELVHNCKDENEITLSIKSYRPGTYAKIKTSNYQLLFNNSIDITLIEEDIYLINIVKAGEVTIKFIRKEETRDEV